MFVLNKWLNSLNIFINAMLPMGGGGRRALPRTSFVSLQDKTAKQYLQQSFA